LRRRRGMEDKGGGAAAGGGGDAEGKRMGRLAEEYGRPPRKYAEIEAALAKGEGTLADLAVGGELQVPEFNVLLRERFVQTVSRATSIGISQSKKDKMQGLLGYRGRKCVHCGAKVQGRVLLDEVAKGGSVVKVVKNEACKAYVEHAKAVVKAPDGAKVNDNRVESRYTARHLSMVDGVGTVSLQSKKALAEVEAVLKDFLPPLAAPSGAPDAGGKAKAKEGKKGEAKDKEKKGEAKGKDKAAAEEDEEELDRQRQEELERGRRKKLYKDVLVSIRNQAKEGKEGKKGGAAKAAGKGPSAASAAGRKPPSATAKQPKEKALAAKKPESTAKPKDRKGKGGGEPAKNSSATSAPTPAAAPKAEASGGTIRKAAQGASSPGSRASGRGLPPKKKPRQ